MGAKSTKQTSTPRTDATATSVRRLGDRSGRRRIVQNYLLVWVDANVTTSNEDCQQTLEHLRSIVNDVTVFTQPEECVTFLQSIQLEKVFLIASSTLGQNFTRRIHPITQIDSIYILCGDKSGHEGWVKKWPKVRGVFTQIKSISNALELAVKQCDQDCAAVSFATIGADDASMINLNQLEPSFMYTKLFKNTLLNMEHDRKRAVTDLVKYCLLVYVENPAQIHLVHEFSRNYHLDQAICWYTRECFTYQMLNRALRLLEADIIANMGFFIHDLHQQIQWLHQQQVGEYKGQIFLVYRGQGLSKADFEKLEKNRGGLISFNCFLSTSRHRDVPMMLAESSACSDDNVGILIVMTIDSNITSIPFADIEKVSFFAKEAEILFSMHTVFRIGTIKPKDHSRSYFEVTLSLSTDADIQLEGLVQYFDVAFQESTGWERMGQLLIQVGQSNKAEELYDTLLEQTSNHTDRAWYHHQLGTIKYQQGDYKEALSFYERALQVFQKIFPADHPQLASSYSNIASVYKNTGKYSQALSFYERAFEILRRSLPANHTYLAISYNNIASVYDNRGEYAKALSFYERALEILRESLPANHPHLAISASNIGLVYQNMAEYSKALFFFERAIEIQLKSLPTNHPHLATSYNNCASVYDNMGEYSKALSTYERALQIRRKCVPSNHPHLATSYSNIAWVYKNTGEYSKSLSFFEQALDIQLKSLPVNQPSLAVSYSKLASMYQIMGKYSKALSTHERALEIRQKSLPADHPDFAITYNNIGSLYQNTGEYSKALSFVERAIEIWQKTLPVTHPNLKSALKNMKLLKSKSNKN